MTVLPPLSDRPGDLNDLHQFGVALTRDDRLVLDHSSASALVDRLFRQAALETVGESDRSDTDRAVRDDARVRAFGQFVRLHRRHVRRLALDDSEFGWDENGENAQRNSRNGDSGVGAAVRALPLELREPLLIVVVAGFTHRDAASALDISLATLITRLTKARERVAVSIRPQVPAAPRAAVSHLRVVK